MSWAVAPISTNRAEGRNGECQSALLPRLELDGDGIGFGASLALALAPRCVVGVFRVHVFGQAMLEIDCRHCVSLFVLVVSVSDECIIL